MSHIDSITPPGPVTVNPGASVDFDVAVSGVPSDVTGNLSVAGSDGVSASVVLTLDNPNLTVLIGGTGTLLGHQIRTTLGGLAGTVTVVSVTGGVAKLRYAAS